MRTIAVLTVLAWNAIILAALLTVAGVALSAERSHPTDPEGFAGLAIAAVTIILVAAIAVSTVIGVVVALVRAAQRSVSPATTLSTGKAIRSGTVAAAVGLVVPVLVGLLFFHP